MTISDLAVMESVVETSPKLSWKGWDVRTLTHDDAAIYKADGIQVDGKWYREKVFGLNRDGWNIPDRLVKVHA